MRRQSVADRFRFIPAVCVLVALAVAGCGDSAAPEGTAAAASESAVTPVPSAPTRPPGTAQPPAEGATADAGTGQSTTGPLLPATATAPPIVFEPRSMNLGLLAEGASGTGTVKVRNVGNRPIKILTTRASCACTYAADLAGTVLATGEAVDLTATLTPKPGLGNKREQIRVMAEGYSGYVEVDVLGEVVLPIRAIPAAVEAYKVGLAGQVVVTSLDEKPFRIIRAGGRPPVFVGFDPAVDAPRNSYTLRWDLEGYTRETMPWWWVVETDRPDTPLVDLRIQHEWTKVARNPPPLWIRGDLRVLAGVLRPGQTYEFKTKLKYNPKGRADPRAPLVQAATPGIIAELLSHEVVGTEVHLTVRVTVLRADPGLLFEQIDITSGGFMSPVWLIATLDA